jgi:hypothetical protein
MSVKVNNVNGTTDNTCRCNSWLEHWINFGGETLPTYCPEAKCISRPEVGAHVQADSLSDLNWYIVPLCKLHNSRKGESLEILDSTKLIPANVSKTCGKK